jgi:hypothetical protein
MKDLKLRLSFLSDLPNNILALHKHNNILDFKVHLEQILILYFIFGN